MYFPPIPKKALEDALSFALSMRHPGTVVTLVPKSDVETETAQAAETKEEADRAG